MLEADWLSFRSRRQQRLNGRYIISAVGETHPNRRAVQDGICHIFDFAEIQILAWDGDNASFTVAGQNDFLVQPCDERFFKDDVSLGSEDFDVSALRGT